MGNKEHNTRDHTWSQVVKNEGLIIRQCECSPPQESREYEIGPTDAKGLDQPDQFTLYQRLFMYLAGDPVVGGRGTDRIGIPVQMFINDPYDMPYSDAPEDQWRQCDFCGPAHKISHEQGGIDRPDIPVIDADLVINYFSDLKINACTTCVGALMDQMFSGGG